MSILLVIAAGTVLWLAFWQRQGCRHARAAAVFTFVCLAAIAALLTEGLSLFTALCPSALAVTWGIVAVGVTLLCRSSLRHFSILRTQLPSFSAGEKGLLAIPVVIASLLLAIALAAPPTTYDAHTYHLPRVYHWIRQGSVDFYATANGRQNFYQPLAEYAILHLRLLTGTDRLFNLVQWSAFLASLCLVSLLARECGLARRGQLLATAIAATTPMVIMQATSCQNDLFAASFCLALAYGLIRLSSPGGQARDAWLCGLALGCALLTKGTSYLFCLPLLLIFGIRHLGNLQHQDWRLLVTRWTLIFGLALVINAGFYARNHGVYGHPLGDAQSGVTARQVSCGLAACNVVRNLASHTGTPFPAWNRAVSEWVSRITGKGKTFENYDFSIGFSLFEDDTGNLPHLLLAGLCTLLLFVPRGKERHVTRFLWLSAMLAAGFICALLLWQPWCTRFHTFLFLLLAPVCAWVLSRAWRFGMCIAIALTLYAFPFLLLNVSRPVISLMAVQCLAPQSLHAQLRYRPSVFLSPRMNQYFGRDVEQRLEYEAAMAWLPRDPATEIGLLTGSDDPEYRLCVVAERASGHLPRLVPLVSETPRLAPPVVSPRVIFDTRPEAARTKALQGFAPRMQGRFITVWMRE